MKRIAVSLIFSLGLASVTLAQQKGGQYADLGSDVVVPHGQEALVHNGDGSITFNSPTVYEAGAQRSIFVSKELASQVGTAYCGKMGRSFGLVKQRKPVRYERWAQIDQNGNTFNFGQFNKPSYNEHVIEWIICR